MLRRRKVLTRKQYEKRRRRHQFVDSICDVSPPRQQANQQLVQLTSPLSEECLNSHEALEIYNGNYRSMSHKRGRPRGIRQTQRSLEPSLCLSSKSSYTDSDGESQNLSETVFSNEETNPSLQSFGSIGDAIISPVHTRYIRKSPITVEMGRVSVSVSRHPTNQVFQKEELHIQKSQNLNGLGAKMGHFLWCCGYPSFFISKPTVIPKRTPEPGISPAEERKLRRLFRKRISQSNGLPANSSNLSDAMEVDQIEVIPVDDNFQSTGSFNYAEMENTGMVFAPNAPLDPEQSNNVSPPLPWWKRENWRFSYLADGFGSQDVSNGRTSAYTKKISNRQNSNICVPLKDQLQDTSPFTIHEETPTLEMGRNPSQLLPGKAVVDKKDEVARPFQVYMPKLERSKKLAMYKNREDELSEGSISLKKPRERSAYRYSDKRHQSSRTPVIVETLTTENESEIGSETDLSELIHRRDFSNENDGPRTVYLGADPDTSMHDENDAVFDILAASNVPIEHIVNANSSEQDIYENDASNAIEQNKPMLRAGTSLHDGRNSRFPYGDVKTSAHIRSRNANIENSDADEVERNKVPLLSQSSYSQELLPELTKGNPFSKQSCHENSRYQSDRGRGNDLIDLTNHEEPCTSTRKRSKSPIRLYGDPPFPYRLDGSPVGGKRSCFWPTSVYRDQNIREKELPVQLEDIATLQNIMLQQNDVTDMIGAFTVSSNNHTLHDGSKFVMLKPIVNVFKIETADGRPRLEVSKKEMQSFPRKHSRKLDLQIQTVLSDRENYLAMNSNEHASNLCASPVVTVSIDDDERSIDGELKKLAESEKLLRKELEEIQKRSAERRWEIEIEETADNGKSACRQTAVDSRHDIEVREQPSPCAKTALSVIDVSCIDVDFDQSQSLFSSLPIASAYKEINANKNGTSLLDIPRSPYSFSDRMNTLSKTRAAGNSPISPNTSTREKITKFKFDTVDKKQTEGKRANFTRIPDLNVKQADHIPACTSPETRPSHAGFGEVVTSPEWINSNDRGGLYVPSLSNNLNRFIRRKKEEGICDAIFSTSSHNDEIYSQSGRFHKIREGSATSKADVLIESDASWGAIEDLYLISARSVSESPHQSSTFLEKRDVAVLREKASREFSRTLFSRGTEKSSERVTFNPECVTNQDDAHQNDENNYDKTSAVDFASVESCNAEKSLYARLLQLSPRIARSPDASPRLQSLLHRHKHLMIGSNGAATSNLPVTGNEISMDKVDGKSQRIYEEFVRRSRLVNRNNFAHYNNTSHSIDGSRLPDEMHSTPKIEEPQLSWISPTSKRLERQRKKSAEIQNHFAMRLSPARRRACKSLRRSQLKSPLNEPTVRTATKSMIKLTPTVQQPGQMRRSNTEALVQLYMPVTGDSERESLKKKKVSDQNSRDLLSIASSARSKDLVHSLPSVAKTRNAAAGKPGSLLWEATAAREHR